MEEDEEDPFLLSSLGATSANPEDIERDLLMEATKNDLNSTETEEKVAEYSVGQNQDSSASSSSRERLCRKLRAVQVEIDVVASTLGQVKKANRTIKGTSNKGQDGMNGSSFHSTSFTDCTLQNALAADRIKSLEKTKSQLHRELSAMDDKDGSIKHEDILKDLVRVHLEPKKQLNKPKKPGRDLKSKKKKISVADDGDFDSVLDAASAGFVETERERMISKGIFTPFHRIKGFERCLEQPENRGSKEEKMPDHRDDTESIARAVRSISEAAQARPKSKLLDLEDAPKLDPPTLPFHRLKKPVKLHQSKEDEPPKIVNRKSKKRTRPGPSRPKRRNLSPSSSSEEKQKQKQKEELPNDDEKDGSPYVTLEGGLRIPEHTFSDLFDYQKVGVQWLWELHCQRAGGIIGDEMGLGKTVQVLSFLGSLRFSGMYRPSIVVCPATLLHQWNCEARKWCPNLEPLILHDSSADAARGKRRDDVIRRASGSDSVLLITTYEHLRILCSKLLPIDWGYAVLDEGHRIRNPNADVTLVCKQLRTVHRIVATGAPIQNRLTELWSLFDFVFPGKLGVLPVFESEFAVPISVGGYANASPLQVSTAYRCAVVLRDIVSPYLLRRMKADVKSDLPNKTEHVIFCGLVPEQLSAYRAFLASSEVEQILDGSRNSLYGIDVMRKICNHPDLLERDGGNPDYGNPGRSGKMTVLDRVLKSWSADGHRALVFAQTRQMLDILERFTVSAGYEYRRMDGSTPVARRAGLIDEFNDSGAVFLFLLTTRVGGLGTNLTGADRVVIFDPDWNPSTDAQARERAWRIGQTRDVAVYRLITRGTIEEKVYHRQIYKHFLTNKVLKNPRQRRLFRARDMSDLFTLADTGGGTGTSDVFGKPSADAAVCEADFLGDLFGSGIDASAVDHDAIFNAEDEERMEGEAAEIARKAAEALRESRVLRSLDGVSVPTWTGKQGQAGAPRPKFGSASSTMTRPTAGSCRGAGVLAGRALGSAELLARIRRRNGNGFEASTTDADSLVGEMCRFLNESGGRCSSESIVERFRDRVPFEDLPLFKNLLKEIATLDRSGADGCGSVWSLKIQFHHQSPH